MTLNGTPYSPAPGCSFCGKGQEEVTHLVQGPSAQICNECVTSCVSLMYDVDNVDGIDDRDQYRYQWRVTYTDGTVYNQLGESGEVSIGKLDFTKVKQIDLKPTRPDLPPISLRVDPSQGEKAIKFWQKHLDANTGQLKEIREVLGVQKNVDGKAVKFFVLFGVRGDVIISCKDNV